MAQDSAPPRRSRRGSGAVTLHDVAKLAGVAPITASRALNTPAQVSEEVRKKVADAVERTGYVPNRLAGSLASTRSRLVAAVVPTIAGPVRMVVVERGRLATQRSDASGHSLAPLTGYPTRWRTIPAPACTRFVRTGDAGPPR